MPAKPALIAAGIAAAAALGTAGYFANQWRICSGLEEDYLNGLASMRGNIAIRSFITDAEAINAVDELDDINMRSIEATLTSLHQQCGERGANSAVRKGQEMLLGS